ncbi:MAG: potassium-transporting ATPase subunit KdpC [Spirochaetes bacterium]|nr:potassium-transporting ATPase subunit KdpC [Spirochaetota bacterium]
MKQMRISIILLPVMSILLGFAYPLAMAGIARLFCENKAGGSLVTMGGTIIGSRLIGQGFSGPRYFHGRPSVNNYDGANSGGSNLGPTNGKLIDRAVKNIDRARGDNALPPDAKIPSDLVLASASGLDPHISLDAALLQADRIARERGIDKKAVDDLIERNTERPYFNIWGTPHVNVLALNISLDANGARK